MPDFSSNICYTKSYFEDNIDTIMLEFLFNEKVRETPNPIS